MIDYSNNKKKNQKEFIKKMTPYEFIPKKTR